MARAELVGDVEVQPADVGEREARVLQVLEHVLLDVPGKEVLVGAARLEHPPFGQLHRADGGVKDPVVDVVEVHIAVSDRLLAERHDHEAYARVVDVAHRHVFLCRAYARNSCISKHEQSRAPGPCCAVAMSAQSIFSPSVLTTGVHSATSAASTWRNFSGFESGVGSMPASIRICR